MHTPHWYQRKPKRTSKVIIVKSCVGLHVSNNSILKHSRQEAGPFSSKYPFTFLMSFRIPIAVLWNKWEIADSRAHVTFIKNAILRRFGVSAFRFARPWYLKLIKNPRNRIVSSRSPSLNRYFSTCNQTSNTLMDTQHIAVHMWLLSSLLGIGVHCAFIW